MVEITNVSTRIVDTVSFLGFGLPNIASPSAVDPGEMLVHYGGWSMEYLYNHPLVRSKNAIGPSDNRKYGGCNQEWYKDKRWFQESVPQGIYRLALSIAPEGKGGFTCPVLKMYGWSTIRFASVVATALLVHHLQTGKNLLEAEGIPRKEEPERRDWVGFYWSGFDNKRLYLGQQVHPDSGGSELWGFCHL